MTPILGNRPRMNPKVRTRLRNIFGSAILILLSSTGMVYGQDLSYVQALSPWPVGSSYPYQLQAQGGTGSLTWRKVAGELPEHVNLIESGKFDGIPTVARPEPYIFTVEVEDKAAQKMQMRFSILVTSSLRIVAPVQSAAAPGAAPSPSRTPAQSNSEKVSITVLEQLNSPDLYFEPKTSEIKKDQGGALIEATLKTREKFEDKDYCIVHAVKWTKRGDKFESDDNWYLFQYLAGKWKTAPLEKSARLL